jgi:antibiotic biosynthesis monooxygenase (ABM) superfamily enzyme
MFGSKRPAPEWAGTVLVISSLFLMIMGFLAMLGTMFPVEESNSYPKNRKEWIKRYRLLVGTVLSTIITASLYTLVHFTLPNASH